MIDSLATDRFAQNLLRRAGWLEPPVDAVTVAARLGITVAVDVGQAHRGRRATISLPGAEQTPAIFLRPEVRRERHQWAVAHEIGEHFAHELFTKLKFDPREMPSQTRERVANALAPRLLLPRDWFVAAGQSCDWDLFALKRRFGTASHELIARRLLDCADGVLITIVDEGRITFRADAFRRRPQQAPCERAALENCRRRRAPCDMRADELRVRVWPVYEADRRREIVVTQPHADQDW